MVARSDVDIHCSCHAAYLLHGNEDAHPPPGLTARPHSSCSRSETPADPPGAGAGPAVRPVLPTRCRLARGDRLPGSGGGLAALADR
jgi:hypothetical protein